MSGDLVLRPLPRPTSHSAPFWSATTEGRFLIQRCTSCDQASFYPRVNCPACGSLELSNEDASGRATVFTYTIARRPTHSAFADAGPSIIAIVELEEGPHVTTNIIDCDPAEVSIGMAVEVTFADEIDGIALPLFRPALAPSDGNA
ncbi:MAG: putative OB-fold protein [Acidimicrobiales bacterium]|jgi:uncharacterized protein